MTGPEHYKRAEQLLLLAEESMDAPTAATQLVWEAQAHATLALTAATALNLDTDYSPEYAAAVDLWKKATA